MENIGNVKYIDAYYIDSSYGKERELGNTKLTHHDAYGYVHRDDSTVVITFIREKGKEEINKKDDVIKGLVIPASALISNIVKSKLHFPNIGSSVAVSWHDITIVANQPIYECPLMYTEGILVRIVDDHIVLKDPETIRTKPLPIKNHPTEKPLYYIIPISFITEVTIH